MVMIECQLGIGDTDQTGTRSNNTTYLTRSIPMKTILLTTIVTLSMFSISAEEGWKQKKQKGSDGFVSQAEQYDQRAEKLRARAEQEQDPTLKSQYLELAEKNSALANHKRNASNARKQGKQYNWDEYHQTHAEAKALWKEIQGKKGMTPKTTKDHKQKKQYNSEASDGSKKGGTTSKYNPSEEKGAGSSKTYTTESGFKIRTSL